MTPTSSPEAPAALRPELGALPARLASLPIDRGYPVPWFVSWIDGVPEFRALDAAKWRQALAASLCWVCGQKLGRHRVFVIGPMCGVNRITSEPPCHAECAEWSAKHCPFLSRPHATRRDATELLASGGAQEAAGCPLDRNPGVTLLWWTRTYATFRAEHGNAGLLLELGAPERVKWITAGRPATRGEALEAIVSGMPALRETIDYEPTPGRRLAAAHALEKALAALETLLPDDRGLR
jgi:hypothetical protein